MTRHAPQVHLHDLSESELRAALTEAYAQIGDLSDALRAAVAGDLLPAQRYVAAEVLGIRDLYLGGEVLSFLSSMVIKPGESLSMHCVRGHSSVHYRRLWLPPEVAPHFQVDALDLNGALRRWPDPLPGTLFAERCGRSPQVGWTTEPYDQLSLQVTNTSASVAYFEGYLFGSLAEPGTPRTIDTAGASD